AWINRWQPDAVLCGHIHQAPFTADGSWVDRVGTTWVFNAGANSGPVPPRVEIDLARNRAVWTSLAGRQEVSLAGVRPTNDQ
ncbi:MAG: metallophosphoesterase family protein, partial [Acidimicrobiales bacterium]